MMLATKGLRVALATTHIPLSKVSQHIQADSLEQTIKIIHNSLQGYGIVKPHIVVCGTLPVKLSP